MKIFYLYPFNEKVLNRITALKTFPRKPMAFGGEYTFRERFSHNRPAPYIELHKVDFYVRKHLSDTIYYLIHNG